MQAIVTDGAPPQTGTFLKPPDVGTEMILKLSERKVFCVAACGTKDQPGDCRSDDGPLCLAIDRADDQPHRARMSAK